MRATSPLLHELLGVFLPLITTNCAVLGVALLNLDRHHGLLESLVFGASAAAGFGLALLLFAAIRERIDGADIPQAFRGAPHRAGHRGTHGARLHGLRRDWAPDERRQRAAGYRRCDGARRRAGRRARLGCDPAAPGYRLGWWSASTHCCRRRSADSAATRAAVPTQRPSRAAMPTSTSARQAARTRCMHSRRSSAADPKPLDPAFGATKPRLVAVIDEARCIGCALCLPACPVDAIVGAQRFMHTVIEQQCTGCELCLPPCPVDCIELRPPLASGTLRARRAA